MFICFLRLLLVPCGIETRKMNRELMERNTLLLVPCGIETYFPQQFQFLWHSFYLYRVELKPTSPFHQSADQNPFTCTVWNWNPIKINHNRRMFATFTCTVWNWNIWLRLHWGLISLLLLVPCGIETLFFLFSSITS